MNIYSTIVGNRVASIACIMGLFLLIPFLQFPLRAALVSDLEPYLGPCSYYDTIYQELGYEGLAFDTWDERYHSTVNAVISEYVSGGGEGECSAGDLDTFLPAGDQLTQLASMLPPWKEEEDLERLRRSDLATVLLEHLRFYECILNEHGQLLHREVFIEHSKEVESASPSGEGGESSQPPLREINIATLGKYAFRDAQIIEDELTIARRALARTLQLISVGQGIDIIEGELTCVQRASLDIRNAFALAAEAGSCLPRTFDVKDPLHPRM